MYTDDKKQKQQAANGKPQQGGTMGSGSDVRPAGGQTGSQPGSTSNSGFQKDPSMPQSTPGSSNPSSGQTSGGSSSGTDRQSSGGSSSQSGSQTNRDQTTRQFQSVDKIISNEGSLND